MGTNYYVRPEGACATQCDNWIHLGKSSMGWTFTFRAHPHAEPPVTDYASWLPLLDLGEIYDECGDRIMREDLLERIEAKRDGCNEVHRDDYLDAEGNRFVPEYFS